MKVSNVYATAVLLVFFAAICAMTPAPAQQKTDQQRIAALEARVHMLEAAFVEVRGNIKEYRFSTAAGSFKCMRCQIEEEDRLK